MKKLLIYLLLAACFESFISSTPCSYCRHKNLSNSTGINLLEKDKTLKGNVTIEVYPMDVFTFRYF